MSKNLIASITVAVAAAAVIYITWPYFTDSTGIYYYYYPSRKWELPVPTYVLVTIVVAIGLYSGLDLMAIPPPISLESMFEDYGEEPDNSISWTNDDEQSTAISDFRITQT